MLALCLFFDELLKTKGDGSCTRGDLVILTDNARSLLLSRRSHHSVAQFPSTDRRNSTNRMRRSQSNDLLCRWSPFSSSDNLMRLDQQPSRPSRSDLSATRTRNGSFGQLSSSRTHSSSSGFGQYRRTQSFGQLSAHEDYSECDFGDIGMTIDESSPTLHSAASSSGCFLPPM